MNTTTEKKQPRSLFANEGMHEMIAARSRYGKVYALGANRFQAVTYAQAVHEFDAGTGQWEEIDRSLRLAEDGVTLLENNKRGKAFGVGIRGARTVGPRITRAQAGNAAAKAIGRTAPYIAHPCEQVLEKLQAEAAYEDIFDGVDLLVRTGERPRHEVVFKSAGSIRAISFTGGVSANASEVPSVRLYDANGLEGAAQLTQGTAGEFTLIPDAAFAASAAYPVTMAVTAGAIEAQSSAIEDTYVSSQNPATNFSGDSQLWVADNPTYGTRYSYLKVNTLPKVSAGHHITRAFICCSQYTAPAGDMVVMARAITGPWNPLTVTYNTAPAYDGHYQDYLEVNTGSLSQYYRFDVTSLARDWYLGKENHGICLQPRATMPNTVRFCSMEGARKPYMLVEYTHLGGLEDYLAYDSQGVGRAGSGSVNLCNGNLVFAHGDTQMNGELLPVSVTHYYNACDSDRDDFSAGKGWRTSVHQTLHRETLNGSLRYVYTDGDGTRHYFELVESKWKDMSGLSLELTFSGATATIRDKGDNLMTFPLPTEDLTDDNRLTQLKLIQSISDAVGNTITVTPDASNGLKVASVMDGAGRVTAFDYTNGMLSAIRTPWQTEAVCTRFAYTGGKLTSVAYEDGKVSVYTYDTAGSCALLASVQNHDGLKVAYTYANQDKTEGYPYSITAAKVTAGGTTLNDCTYAYGNMLTIVTDELSGKSIRYHFNDDGNAISMDDGLGYALYAAYDRTGDNAQTPINHPTMVSRMQKVVTNLLKNGSIEEGDYPWVERDEPYNGTTVPSDGSIRTMSVYHWGGLSYQLRPNNGSKASVTQTPGLSQNQGYTLSAFVKSDAPRAYLRARYMLGGQQAEVQSDPVEIGTAEFQRISVSFTLPAGTSSPECAMVAEGAAGNAWFDDVQLEEGLTCNHYNLLINSDFRSGTLGEGNLPEYWTKDANDWRVHLENLSSCEVPPPAHLKGNMMRLTGDPGRSVELYHQFRLYGKYGDRFSAGGWCCAFLKGKRGADDGICRIKVQFSVGGTTWATGGLIDFNDEEGNWQFASGNVSAPIDNYQWCRFVIAYNRQINDGYFTNMYLYPEQFAQELGYDAKGNRLTAKALSGLTSGAEYDAFNNMTKYTQPGRSVSAVYEYGATDDDRKKHLLKKSTSPLGIISEYTYDNKGNPETTQTRDAGSTAIVKAETAYTPDQNYVLTQKDARGKVITTQTDPQKGTTQSVTDPTGQTVSYAYDALRRITATQTVSEGKTYQNTYTYDGDQLAQVKHNTTDNALGDVTYTFAYDAAKRPKEVKVGSQTLSSTAYNADGTVKSAEYGNTGKVAYTYDAFKRVTGVKIDNDIQDRYTYAYNANGQVAHVTDNRLGRVSQSEYDLSNRPMRAKTHENGSHVHTGEVVYDVFGNLMEFKEKVGTGYTKYATSFGYDEENRPTTLTYGDAGNKLTQAYDGIGRLGTRTLTVGGRAYNTSYTYEAGGYGEASTTPLIKSITQDGKTTTYAYDDAGNIQSVDTPFNPVQVEDLTGKLYEDSSKRLYAKDETGLERILYAIEGKGQAQTTVSKVNYAYDKLGQLTRIDDPYDLSSGQQGTTTTYAYDLGGNILEKRVFPYTLPSESPIGAVKVVPYAYTDANWKDKLTSYNGTSITYDTIGNPRSDGTWSYEWESGRQLTSMTKSDATNVTYTYNVDGLRIRKTVNGIATDYTLHGKHVVHLKKDGDNLHFFYDAQGRPAIVEWGSAKYGYVHNLQGDIVAIIDGSGNQVVEYTYDAWGKPLSKTGILATTLGTLNPFRYRGYVYDEETQMYLLNSRYYNPITCRIINADTTDTITASIDSPNQDKNLYAYCDNNPVARADADGNFWNIVIGALVGGIIGGISSIVGQAISGEGVNWVEVGISAASGAVTGAITAAAPGMGALATGIVHGAVGSVTYAATEKLAYGRDPSLLGTLTSGVTAGLLAGGTRALGNAISKGKIEVGRISGERARPGYPGVRYKTNAGPAYSVELHPSHNTHGPHMQVNKWIYQMKRYEGTPYRLKSWHFDFKHPWKGIF